MGVVVKRYMDILTIIINFPYSTCISSFLGSSIPTSLFILKMFFHSCFCYFLQYIANVTQRTFAIVKKKSRSREYNWRAEANLPALLNYRNFRYIYLFIYWRAARAPHLSYS